MPQQAIAAPRPATTPRPKRTLLADCQTPEDIRELTRQVLADFRAAHGESAASPAAEDELRDRFLRANGGS